MSQSAPARHPSTIATLPGQVLALDTSGGGGGGGGSAAAASPAMPVLTRAFSVGALPTTPRLEGFIVNWCRFHASHPILGAFHHVNHSSILAGGRNKFFDDSLVTPIQYQEVKRLRHNPYVGGGYIRSHTTLFHDLHIGYWAKERMAAREQRKKDMVSELKRPRLTQDAVQAVSAASSLGLLRSAESAESASAASAPTASRERGSSGPAVVGADGGVGGVGFGSVAANPASSAPTKKKAAVEPQYTLASLVSPRSLRRSVDFDAASTNSVGSAPAAVSGSPLPSTSTVAEVAMATLAAGRAAGSEPRSAGKVSGGGGGGGSGSRMGPTFSQLLGRHGDGEHEEKLPPSHSAAGRGAAAAGESPRAGRAIPATMLDAHHGKSRRFEDFYTFEKLPPMSVRVMPKLRAGPDGATAGTSGAAAGAAATERDTKTAETEAQRVRQLGTEAKSGSMVGRGAYSSVRVGTHISTGDRFAIKQISKRYLYSEEEREAIRREVRIHCSPALAHDNIVFLYDYFEDEQTFYLVLDHCEGGDLETYMRVNKRKGVTELQAQMLFQQLMKALAFLHDQNIIHGDIKPQNVLLSRKPFAVVKICDFGNARYAKDVRYFSKTGSVSKVPYTSIMGTQGYIAPEILAKQHYGTGIDMWAAGIMCFFMLGGYQPFNPPSACLKCTTGPDFNDPCWSKFSEACMDFIARLLQRDPAKRMTAADARTHPWIVGL